MLSVTPVAMAMLPEKVEHAARADASPPFWMVVVAELLHEDCAASVSGYVPSYFFRKRAYLLPFLPLPKLARYIWPPFVMVCVAINWKRSLAVYSNRRRRTIRVTLQINSLRAEAAYLGSIKAATREGSVA